MEVAGRLRRLLQIQTVALWAGVAGLCLALLWEVLPRHRPPEAAHAPQVLEALATRIWLTEALGSPSDIPLRNTRPCAEWVQFTTRLGQPRADLIAAMTSTIDGRPAWTIECRPVRLGRTDALGPRSITLELPALVEAEAFCRALRETVAAADLPPRYALSAAAIDSLTRHYAWPAAQRSTAPRTRLVGELRLDDPRRRGATIASLDRVRRHLDGEITCRRDGHWLTAVVPLGHWFDRQWYEWW